MQIDLVDYFTGDRPWTEFHDYLQRLPRWKKFHSAIAMDEEMAEAVWEQVKIYRKLEEEGGSTGPTARSPEGWTPEIQVLQVLDEHVQSLIRVLIGVNSPANAPKPPDVAQWPRPFTAVDQMEYYETSDDMSDLADEFGIQH